MAAVPPDEAACGRPSGETPAGFFGVPPLVADLDRLRAKELTPYCFSLGGIEGPHGGWKFFARQHVEPVPVEM
jgi:hypothetical protein